MKRISKADEVSALAERVVKRSLGTLEAALAPAEDLEQVKIDAKLPPGLAPMYLHVAMKMGLAVMKEERAEGGAGIGQLNIMIVKQSESREQWIKDVAEFKKMGIGAGAPKLEVLDVDEKTKT